MLNFGGVIFQGVGSFQGGGYLDSAKAASPGGGTEWVEGAVVFFFFNRVERWAWPKFEVKQMQKKIKPWKKISKL